VTGSRSGAYDDKSWIHQLAHFIQDYRKQMKECEEEKRDKIPRMVGVCFGCQIVAHALGGRVQPNTLVPHRVVGTESLTLTNEFFKKEYVESARKELGLTSIPNSIVALESHGDSVLILPEDAQLLGYSSSSMAEIYEIDGHILGLQCHPEFTKEVLTEKIIPYMTDSQLKEKAMSSLERPTDSTFLRKVVQHFLGLKAD